MAVVLPSLAFALRFCLGVEPWDPSLINLFLGPVALTAYVGGWRPGLLATALSVVFVDYSLISPLGSLVVEQSAQRIALAVFTVSALLITALIHRTRQAHARAKDTGELLAVTLSSISDAVITTDVGGRVTFLNTEAERLTGWTEAMARGQELAGILRLVDPGTRSPIVRSGGNGRRPTAESRPGFGAGRALLISRDGREIPIEESVSAIREAGGTPRGTVVVFRDQSEKSLRDLALSASEERGRMLFEEGGDPYFLHDEKGRIADINRWACKSLGYTRAELLALNVTDVVSGVDLPQLFATWKSVLPGESMIYEGHFHRRKDGTKFPVEVRMTCYLIRNEKVIFAAIQDVTERVEAERELKQFREMVSDLPQMIWSSGPDGTINYGNRRWMDYSGQPVDGDWQPLIHPDDWVNWRTAWTESIRTGQPSEIECRLREKATGEYRWHLGRALPLREGPGQIVRWFGTWTDIDARKQSEEALQKSEARFRQLVESMPQMVFVVSPAGRKEYLSRAWHDFTGMDGADDVDANWTKYIHPEDFLRTMAIWRNVMKSAQPFAAELRLREARNQSYRWILARATPIRDEDGRVLRWIGTCTDIDKLKSTQTELQQARDTLEQRTGELAAVNRELEAFSYTVSHDLRAPVRAMDGFAQALLDDFGEGFPEDGRRFVGIIRDSAHRMGKLIDDLLAFSQLGRTQMNRGNVEMARLVADCLEELGVRRDSPKVEVRLGRIPPCEGDRSLLKQVWMNLLSNALKYSGKRDRAIIEVGARVSTAETVYFVKDNGAGFDVRYAGKLFGVFQRLHHVREFEGTGVGLATVQRIVKRHGGRVWAESVLDQGATFSFTVAPATPAVP